MAIGGSTSPSFIAEIVDGKLTISRQALRIGVVSDIDIAIHDLLQGKKVFVSAYGDFVARIQRTVDMALGAKGETQ